MFRNGRKRFSYFLDTWCKIVADAGPKQAFRCLDKCPKPSWQASRTPPPPTANAQIDCPTFSGGLPLGAIPETCVETFDQSYGDMILTLSDLFGQCWRTNLPIKTKAGTSISSSSYLPLKKMTDISSFWISCDSAGDDRNKFPPGAPTAV